VLLGAWVKVEASVEALDIGTGTGMIALMIAQRNPYIVIDAIEIDEASAMNASNNAANSPWSKRITVFNQDLQSFPQTKQYDLIVSNPPYFLAGTSAPIKRKHQSRHATSLPFLDLIKSVQILLKEEGRFSLILPVIEGNIFIEMAEAHGLFLKRLTTVYSKEEKPAERLLMELGKTRHTQIEESSLIIQEGERHEYTAAYKKLTKDFYL